MIKLTSKNKSVTRPDALSHGFIVGTMVATRGSETPSRIALLLWGPAGSGKTVFSCTTPGEKLFFSFSDNEHEPISRRKDVHIVQPHKMGIEEMFRHCQNDNPFELDKTLGSHPEIRTVIVDNSTAIAYRALQKSVLIDQNGKGNQFIPTMEAPGIAAYGGRNAILLEVLTGFLRVTSKHNVNIVITAHEDDPTMKKEKMPNGRVEEVVDYVSIQLGGKLVNNMTWRLSEIWHMRDMNNKREITVRNYAQRRPMKTRMFDTLDRNPRFEVVYDPSKPDTAKGQMTIAAWHEEWLANGRSSLPIPRVRGSGTED